MRAFLRLQLPVASSVPTCALYDGCMDDYDEGDDVSEPSLESQLQGWKDRAANYEDRIAELEAENAKTSLILDKLATEWADKLDYMEDARDAALALLDSAEAALADMNSHGPDGHNVTNQQYVDCTVLLEQAEAALADIEGFLASRGGLLSSYRDDLRARAEEGPRG